MEKYTDRPTLDTCKCSCADERLNKIIELEKEHSDLQLKIANLSKFLISEEALNISQQHLNLLDEQKYFMSEYLDSLEQVIRLMRRGE